MPTYDFHDLWQLARRMDRPRFLAILRPHAEFFREKGVPLEEADPDFHNLCWLMQQHAGQLPPMLDEAMTLLLHATNPQQEDRLASYRKRYRIDLEDENLPQADLAAEAWLREPMALRHLYSETLLETPRTYRSFLAADRTEANLPIAPDLLVEMEGELARWFQQQRRGKVAKIFDFQKDGLFWFLIYHGRSIRRITCIDDDRPSAVRLRPDAIDKVIYDPTEGKLTVGAAGDRVIARYRALFGKYLFEDPDHFGDFRIHSLQRFLRNRENLLRCDDVPGLARIELKEITFTLEGAHSGKVTYQAEQLDALLEEYQLPLPGSALVARVKFRVHFSDRRWPRTIELIAPNRAKIVWDTYGRRIAHWLRRRNLVRHLLEKAA